MSSRGGRSVVERELAKKVFFAAIDRGELLVTAVHEAGIGFNTAYRWIHQSGRALPKRTWKTRSPEVKEQFWAELRAGKTVHAAARAVCVSRQTGRDWFNKGGGVRPPTQRDDLEAKASAGRGRLTFTDRCRIEELMLAHYRPARIAALLGRPRSTITRELARGRTTPGHQYRAVIAQSAVEKAAGRSKELKLQPRTPLWSEVAARLRKRHSPEQISNTLKITFPGEPEMWVSHETIYQALYVQGRGSLREEVKKALRTGRVRRKPQGRTPRTGPVTNMINISERPAEAEADNRAVPGHWEGDLILGAGNKSAIGTLVERTTGFVMLLHLPKDHTAATVAEAMTAVIPQIPEVMRRSLTWDQGSEMALHTQITEATGLPIYFCDPHSPWQRATNENTNGLLRQYFPKGTDLSVHGPGILANVAAELNGRPRKRHNWKTPAEELDRLLKSDESFVA